jgi:ubiquinone/menaquinone biosynthesis C-methylase UbiE
MPEFDKWSRWLLETRFGGDEKIAELGLRLLRQLRDTLLEKAALKDGQVLLDVGAGDGLIAFGALEKLGPSGRVILADISRPLLDHAREAAEKMGVTDRCEFIEASAESLSAIASESIDVVTTRSVLIFVEDKLRALKEFYRVLKPGGRTALFETVNRREQWRPSEIWTGVGGLYRAEEIEPIRDLATRLVSSLETTPLETMTSAGHTEYLHMCEDAGFAATHMALSIVSAPHPPAKIESLLKVSPNPLWPAPSELMDKIFTAEERARFIEYMRPLVESGKGIARFSSVFIWAFKAPIPENPW